jgi:predicted dehydrogenase
MTENSTRRYKFVVVGTGAMAATMMPTFAQAGVDVTGVLSRDPERSRRFASIFGIPTAGPDLVAYLKSQEVDAVYIANAPQDHATAAIAALEAGKAVLCEKPMAVSATEAERVVDAARRTGKLCMEGLWTLFLPSYERFLALARAETFGEARHLIADFGYPVSEEVRPQLYSLLGGGVMLDRAIYLIALAISVFGPVERMDAQLDFTDGGVDRDVSLQLSHQGGKHSQLTASFTSLMSNTATLACSKGSIRLEPPLVGSETISTQHASLVQPPQETPLPTSVGENLIRSLRAYPQMRRIRRALGILSRRHFWYGRNPYLPELRHFIELLGTGAQESNIVPLQLSLNIQRIITSARADHRR